MFNIQNMYLLEYFVFLIILSSVKNENIWHSNFLNTPRSNTEDFTLKKAWVDENLSQNFTANFWKSINIRNASYAAGISINEILLLKITNNKSDDFIFEKIRMGINENCTDASFLEIWNKTSRQNDIFLITVSSNGNLKWFDVKNLEVFWSSYLEYVPKFMKIIFNHVSQKHQLIITTLNYLHIYNFNSAEKKLWLIETLQFENPIGSFDTTAYRNNFFLLIPQETSLQIFQYKHDHFQQFRNLSAAGIDQVVAFQENFKTFFAVNGIEAAIYQFGRKNIILKEKTLNSHLKGIKYWLPVTLNNLKQNLILFAQRILEHGSHKSIFTEIFTYKNGCFEKHEDIPCQIFGEKLNNLHCLTDFEKSVGIEGATYISIGHNLGLLLANRNFQNLFRISTEYKIPDSPIQREIKILNDTRNRLQELLDEKLDSDTPDSTFFPKKIVNKQPTAGLRTSASSFEQKPAELISLKTRINTNSSQKLDEMLQKILELKTKMDDIEQMEKTGIFKELIVNGTATIENVEVTKVLTKTLNNEDTESILEDIVNKNTQRDIKGTKTFADLSVENIIFETVNGINASDILFQNPELMEIYGDLTFKNPVAIFKNINSEWINDFPSSSIVQMTGKIQGDLTFQNINVNQLNTEKINKLPLLENSDGFDLEETVYLPQNVTVKNINGQDFEEFLKELCLINIPTHFTSTIKIDGDIIIENTATTQFLNTIKFPENYFFLDGSEGVSITGSKNFSDTLEGFEIRTNGQYINGIKTTDLFTLSTEQEISKTIFSNLEVTNTLQHDGKTIGDQVSKFLPNPTFLESKTIKSNVNFEELEVTGSIIIDENFNTLNFHQVLEDIVYKDETPSINSIKEFPEGLTIRNNLSITSNSINLIGLDQFVTKDTNQILNIGQLTGNVSIETMEINQLINGINISALDQETVKTSGEQFISSFLIFKDDLEINNLEIGEILNEVPVGNYFNINNENEFKNNVVFRELQAKNLVIRGNFNGNIREINLGNFVENRMSYTKEQRVDGNFSLENSHIDVVNCDFESVKCRRIFDKKYILEELMGKISTGYVRVKDLIVAEDLTIEHLNGIPLGENEELQEKSIIINGDVHFSNLNINKLSEVSFKTIMDNVVFKNESSFKLSGTKTFQHGLVVKKLIETDKLNNIPIENLLTKEGSQNILAPIEIFGNVTFDSNLKILNTLNDVSIDEIRSYFETTNNSYVIKSDMLFDRLAYVFKMDIEGYLNDKKVENVLNNMAYGTETLSFLNEFEFIQPVIIDGDVEIENRLNDINLSTINENIVYLNKTEDNSVKSMVTFTSSDTLAHNLYIETDLITKWLTGIDLESLEQDAVFLNRGFLPGFYHFENVTIHEKLLTKFVNEISMNNTIPLGTNQEIHRLSFKNVAFLNNVSVGNLVNQRNMLVEHSNTVLSGEEQEIFSELRFLNNTIIRKSLEVAGLLNGNPLPKIVTTDTNQNLTALYSFPTKINVNSNLYVSGFVNSIDMSVWENGGIKSVSKEIQVVEAPWHIHENLTFKEVLDGNNEIYNFDIEKCTKIIQELNKTRSLMEAQYEADHRTFCEDISGFEEKLEKQIYKFEMLEDMFVLNYPEIIGMTYSFMGVKPSLVLNGIGSCNSDFFVFENDEFVKISEFGSGQLEHIVSTNDGKISYLVTIAKFKSECNVKGTNVWKLENGQVENLQNIESQQQLQESLVPLTFYGLNKYGVTEYRIDPKMAVAVYEFRKWKIFEENTAFVPRGLGTGLAIRTGQKLIKLLRDDPINENEIGFDTSLRGETKEVENSIIPGRNNNKLIVLEVGPERMKKTLMGVVYHEDIVVGRNLDVLKIFEDYALNKVFQKIYTFNPTSLLTLNFGNGETLLLVLENGEKLQVYQYKGIEGFQHRFSADVQGSHMFKMVLTLDSEEPVEVISVVYEDTIRIIKPIMIGNRMNEKIEC